MGKKKQRELDEQAIRRDERRLITESLARQRDTDAREVPGGIELSITNNLIVGHTADHSDPTIALCGESMAKRMDIKAPVREHVGEDLRDNVFFCSECAEQLLADYNALIDSGRDLVATADKMAERLASIRDLADPHFVDETTVID